MHIVCSVHLLSFLCYFFSEPLDPPEPHERHRRQGDGQHYDEQEGMGESIQVDVHVHAVEATVGIISVMLRLVMRFMMSFTLFEMMEAKASIVPVRMSL